MLFETIRSPKYHDSMIQNNDIDFDIKNLAASPYFWGFLVGFILTQVMGALFSLPALVIMFLLIKFTKAHDQIGSGIVGIAGGVVGLIFTLFVSGFFSIPLYIALFVFSVMAKKEAPSNRATIVDIAGGTTIIYVVLTLLLTGLFFANK